jgi:hypothetical protein
MSSFQGIDMAYRNSDEYKSLMSLIKDEYPNMPIGLAELGIAMHKMDPLLYKECMKMEKKQGTSTSTHRKKMSTVVEDGIKIYQIDDPSLSTETIPIRNAVPTSV